MENNTLLNLNKKETQKTIEEFLKNYQLDKISIFTEIDNLSNKLKSSSNQSISNIENSNTNEKINKIEKTLEIQKKSFISKDDFLSLYLSKEFEEIKNTTLNNIKNEIERKFQLEISKYKNKNNLLLFLFIILSITSILLSLSLLFK